MKYYYKSPEELKEKMERQKAAAPSPYRNRTFLTILADVVLFLAVFSALYYSGVLYSVKNLESEEFQYKNIKISGVVAVPEGKNEPDLLHYLRIRNISETDILFPDEASGYDCSRVIFRISYNGITVMENSITPERRRIRSAQTEIYRFTPAAPEISGYDRKKLSFRYTVDCRDETFLLLLK